MYVIGALVTTLDGGTGEVVWAEPIPSGTPSEVGPHPTSSAHGTVTMFDARTGRALRRFDMGAYVALANVTVDQPARVLLMTEITYPSTTTEVRDAQT